MNKLNLLLSAVILTLPFLTSAQKKSIDTMEVIRGVTAHRGNSIGYPENTLVSFQAGIDAHADWIEMDVRKTKDGQIVISHDANPKRTSGVDVEIANTNYSDLQKLDVATDFRKRNNLALQQCPPQRMPLLRDALTLVMKQNRTHASMHLKLDLAADAIAIIKELNAEGMVGFNHSGLENVAHAKKIDPKIPVFWDRLADTNIDDDIKVAKANGFETIVMNFAGVTAENVKKIKAAGLLTGAWTVDDRPTLERMLKCGVDRIYTDDPKLLIKIKKEMGM
jgi:glycerophosphoryl diester phosphodiesterase